MLLRELTYHVTEALDAAINAAIIKIKSDGSMWRKVKQGAINSPELKTIQTALTQLGFKAKPDGWFGPGTAKAVRDFQKSKGLKVDGDPGPNTLKAMANAVGGRGKSVEKPGERQAYLDRQREKPTAQKGKAEGAYKIVTGSGQGTRYKVYDKDGNVIASGRGKGPANIPVKKDPDEKDPRGNQIPIADFKGADTDKKVVTVVDDALKKARANDADANQIAQIVAAGSQNFNNVAGPGERADRAKAIIATVTDTELQDPRVRAALAGELLAIDKVKMDPEEALRKFVQSSYAYVIPEKFRDKATDKQKFEAMVRKAQDEQMMSAFTDPSKAIKIIQDEIKKIEADPSAGGNAMAAGQKGGDDATKPGKGPNVSTDGPQAPGGNTSSSDSGQNSSKTDSSTTT